MKGRAWGAAVCAVVGTLALAAPAAAETVTAYGHSIVRVTPDNSRDNDSIAAAVNEARGIAVPLALADARTRAQQLADGTGLVLGDVEAVEETQDERFGDYGPVFGTFGPGQFCGTVVRTVRRRTRSGRLVRRRVRQTRCFFPDVLLTSVEVTYRATRA